MFIPLTGDTLAYKAVKSKLALLVCLLLFTYGSPTQATGFNVADLKSQTLRYAVKYQKYNAGELEVIIENDKKQIKTTIISHLSFLAKIFLTDLTIESQSNIEHQIAYLRRGHVLSRDNKTVERSFIIDRQQARINLEPSGKRVPINTADIFDLVAFPIALITSDIESIAGKTMQETSDKGIKAYRYLAPQQQTLEINGKKFETWQVTRQKADDITRTVTVWLDKNNQHIPLKVVSARKNKDTVILLLPENKTVSK